jgi:cytochrome c oxidase subunit 2
VRDDAGALLGRTRVVSFARRVTTHARRAACRVAIVGGALTACTGLQSTLDVRGPGAERIAALWWLMLGVAAVVYAIVIAILLRIAFRGPGEPSAPLAEDRAKRWITVGGVALPAVILTAVFVVSLRTLSALRPAAAPSDLTIQVTGRQWWWEIRYPGRTPSDDAVTANEIHIPTGRRVRLALTSTDVIHSLWVPNLQGKTDLVPGRTTVMWLQADRPGVSRGQCAEYCGLQHTRMSLLVVAESAADFDRWLAVQRQPAASPADSLARRGREVFLSLPCAYCHALRDAPTPGREGPDLTHLASRLTLAAGTLSNTPAHLAEWIASPQRLKPGNKMPTTELTPEQLRALVHYLGTLR